MNELFFELIQVSTGQLDCLSRGPSPEEWQQLYDLSKRHGLTALCYKGVVRLYEFGLRAPQDLSIDWMADAENLGELSDAEDMGEKSPTADIVSVPEISNPVRKMLVDGWGRHNGGSFYVYVGKQKMNTTASAIVLKLLAAYELYHDGELTMQHVVECFNVLRQANGHFDKFADGSTVNQVLRKFGIWRFTRSMMWIVGHTLALDKKLLACSPLEGDGRFVLQQIMNEKLPLVERIKYRFWRFVKF